VPWFTLEQDSEIGIAIGTGITAGLAAEQNGPGHIETAAHSGQEKAGGLFGF
jgi:hypothetical protein